MKPAIILRILIILFLFVAAASAYIVPDRDYANSKWGFIDQTGRIVVEPKYTAAGDFSEGLAAVKVGGTHARGGTWGFIDRTGRQVVECTFDAAEAFSEGLAAVRVGEKWGFIGRDGKLRMQPQFEWAGAFHEGLAAFTRDKKYGYIDRTGAVVIEPQFRWAAWFSEGLASVEMPPEGDAPAGLSGYINTKGEMEIVLLPPYTHGYGFSEGVAFVQTADRTYALIDRDGEVVATPDYAVNSLGTFRDGLAEVRIVNADRNEEWGTIDKTGAIVVPFKPSYNWGIRYSEKDGSLHGLNHSMKDEFTSEPLDLTRVPMRHRLIRIWSGEEQSTAATRKHGFMDGTGTVVIKPQFEEVHDFHEGMAVVAVGLKWLDPQR